MNGSGGDNWSYETCKAPVKLSPPTNQHVAFYRPDALAVALCPMRNLLPVPPGLRPLSMSISSWMILNACSIAGCRLCSWSFREPTSGSRCCRNGKRFIPVTRFHHISCLFSLRAKLSGNQSCLWVHGRRCLWWMDGWAVSVTAITQNCVHRSSPNWVCRWR